MQVVLGLNPLSPFLAGTFCHEHLAERTLRAGFWEVKPSAFIYSEHQRDIYIYTAVAGLQGEGGPNIQKHLLSSGRLTKYSREGNPGKICTKQETVINSVWQAGLDLNADSNRKCSFISETSQYREKKQVLYF